MQLIVIAIAPVLMSSDSTFTHAIFCGQLTVTTVINSNKSDLPNTRLTTRSEMEVAKSLKMNLKKEQALLLSETVKENGSLSIAMPTG